MLRSKWIVGRWSFVIRFRVAAPGTFEGPWVILDFVEVQIRGFDVDYPKKLADTHKEWPDLAVCS